MSRRAVFAVLIALSLVIVARPLLCNEVFSFRDHGDYFQPLRWFTAAELLHGRLPLWNAYSASGEPWLANPQTGVFYPPAWIFLFLPFPLAYTLYLFFHLALLACSAYVLFARLTRPGGAALAAAIALTFSGPAMSLLDVSNNLATFAWLPLILWCAISGASSRVSALAIAVSFLAGEPFFAAVGALLFVVARRRGVRDLIDVGLTSFALSAVQLLPFLSMALNSDRARGGLAREQIFHDSMPLRDWLRLAVPPNLHGTAYDPRLGQHFIPIVYVGVLTVLFAVIGVVVGRRRVLGWLALIAVCTIVGAGNQLKPVADALAWMPLTLFRYPARVIPIAMIGICALAAIGVDRIKRGAAWQLVTAAVMFVDVFLQMQPMLITAPFNPHRVPYPAGVGRDSKIIRIDMTRNFDRDAWVSGYLNLYDRRFDAWTAAPIASLRYTIQYQSALLRRDVRALGGLGVGYVIAPGPLAVFRPIGALRGAVLHRNPVAVPLAYLRADAGSGVLPVRSLAFTSSSVFIDVDAPTAGDVVVTQQMAPGWTVTVDEKPATARETSLFRAVPVTRGHHAIRWIYRPMALIVGAILTFGAVVRLLFSPMFVKRMQREKFLHESVENA